MIIGIVGFMNSGKGTVGDLLSSHYGFSTESFAKPLKDACSFIFGWPRHLLEGVTKESREFRETVDEYWSKVLDRPGFTPRLALQLMGTEAGRDVFGKNLWTASCIKRCQTNFSSNCVITDTRFKNEIEAIREANGVVIRVKRGEEPQWHDIATAMLNLTSSEPARYTALTEYMGRYNKVAKEPIHQSEWDWVGQTFNYTIENDGTFADLETKLYDIMVDLKVTHRPFKSANITIEG